MKYMKYMKLLPSEIYFSPCKMKNKTCSYRVIFFFFFLTYAVFDNIDYEHAREPRKLRYLQLCRI